MDYLNLSFKDVFTDINFWESKAQKQLKRGLIQQKPGKLLRLNGNTAGMG